MQPAVLSFMQVRYDGARLSSGLYVERRSAEEGIMPVRPSRLWVPVPSPSNKFTAQDVKPDNRRYLNNRRQSYDSFDHKYDWPGHWQMHARERLNTCAEIVTKVAVLRALGRISDSQPIECTGAVYQDFRGAPKYYQRAHQFPCNPWIGIFTLPEIAIGECPAMWVELVKPLAATDIVPNYVNSGDSGIEKHGTYSSVQSALKEVIQEQRAAGPVNPKLIQHVMNFSLVPKLRESIDLALERAENDAEADYREALQGANPFSSSGVEALNQASINMEVDPGRPTQFVHLTEEYLRLCAKDAQSYQIPLMQGPMLDRELNRLQSLPRGGRDST
jgi:hypothetical protein